MTGFVQSDVAAVFTGEGRSARPRRNAKSRWMAGGRETWTVEPAAGVVRNTHCSSIGLACCMARRPPMHVAPHRSRADAWCAVPPVVRNASIMPCINARHRGTQAPRLKATPEPATPNTKALPRCSVPSESAPWGTAVSRWSAVRSKSFSA